MERMACKEAECYETRLTWDWQADQKARAKSRGGQRWAGPSWRAP